MKKRSKFLAMLLSTAVAVSSLTGISVFAADKTGEEETRTVVERHRSRSRSACTSEENCSSSNGSAKYSLCITGKCRRI